MAPKKPAGRRFPLVPSLSSPTLCFRLTAHCIWTTNGGSGTRSSYSVWACYRALGYSDGSVQVYSVDSGGVNIDLWMDARISATSIVALEFVPSSSTGSAGDGFILSMWP